MFSQNKMLTVAVCTHNRGHLLEPLVEELVKQELETPLEILLVDNSTNKTDTDAADNLARIPQVRVVHSTPPGLSRARNTAIENCRTDIIAFLDDDALPLKGWAQSILAPFDEPEITFIAGPIIPIWPEGGRPHWVPDQFIGCLSALDLGNTDKKLTKHEYAFGANMAFRLDALREIGGFDTAIGRSGTTSLLSEEEVDVQDKMRLRGGVGYYAAKARVHHKVDDERLSRHWFLSRMAWQGVSVALRNSNSGQDTLLANLQQAADKCGLSELPAFFLNESDPEILGGRLSLVQYLVTYLLKAKSFQDISTDGFYTSKNDGKSDDVAQEAKEYHPSTAVPSSTQYLFFDSRPGHHYLYDLYGKIPNSQLVVAEMNQWEGNEGRDIDILERSVLTNVKAVIILTLDPYLFGPNFPYAYEMIKRQSAKRRVYGILHKLPESAQNIERLTRVAPHINLILLDENLVGLVRELVRSQKVFYLPHHAVLGRYLTGKDVARTRRQLPQDKIIISMLGEIREGKGLERLFDALPHLPAIVKHNALFLVVGKAKQMEPNEISNAFLREGVLARVVTGSKGEGYKLVPSPELADYVSASDVGLFLFEKSQKLCMSGMLSNYVMCDIPIIASADSILGQCAEKQRLGWVTDVSDPAGLADTLAHVVKSMLEGKPPSESSAQVKQKLTDSSVMQDLQALMQTGKI